MTTYKIILDENFTVNKRSAFTVEADSEEDAVERFCNGEYEDYEIIDEDIEDIIDQEIVSVTEIKNDSISN